MPILKSERDVEAALQPTFLCTMIIYFHGEILCMQHEENAFSNKKTVHLPHLKLEPNQPFLHQIQDFEEEFFNIPFSCPRVHIPPFCTRVLSYEEEKVAHIYRPNTKMQDLVIYTQFYQEDDINFWENLILHLDVIYKGFTFEFVSIQDLSQSARLPKFWHYYLQKANEAFRRFYFGSVSLPYEIDMECAYRNDHMEAMMKSFKRKHFHELEISPFLQLKLEPLRSLSLNSMDPQPEIEENLEEVTHAGIFLITVNHHMLFLRSKEYSSTPQTYMPPKGRQRPGENLVEAALRELFEETSIHEADIELVERLPLCYYFVRRPKFQSKNVCFFLAVQVKPLAIKLSAEHLDFVYVAPWQLKTYVPNEHLFTLFSNYYQSARDHLNSYPAWLDQSY